MIRIQMIALRWAMGLFIFGVGALILVAPHQFSSASYNLLQNQTVLWGCAFLLSGLTIIFISLLDFRRLISLVAHWIAAGLLFFLAYGFFETNNWFSGFLLSVFSIGLFIAGFFPTLEKHAQDRSPADFFGILTAISFIGGAVLLIDEAGISSFQPGTLGIVLAALIVGVWMIASQVLLHQTNPRAVNKWVWFVIWIPYYLCGIIYLASLINTSGNTSQIWIPVLYYGIFGLVLVSYPSLHTGFRQLSPMLMRTRLAVFIAAVAAIPLVIVVAIISNQEENAVRNEALARQEREARTISRAVSNYFFLNRAAVVTIAQHPSLLSQSPRRQKVILQDYVEHFPDLSAIAIFDQNGNQIIRSDDQSTSVSAAGFPVFELAKSTREPSVDILISPVLHVPVVAFGAPILDSSNQFTGLVSAAVELNNITSFLVSQSVAFDSEIYLVDEQGRVLIRPDGASEQNFEQVSTDAPVTTYLDQQDTNGQFSYIEQNQEILAGYAVVPEINWGIIVQRRAGFVLSSVFRWRETAYMIFIGSIFLLALLGIVVANFIVTPIDHLATASEALAAGDMSVPLPKSRVTEINNLALIFGKMRARLKHQTEERIKVLNALERAKEELEYRVSQRTNELRIANEILLDERARLKAIIDNAPEGIIVADKQGKITLVNPAAERIYGQMISSDVLTGDTFPEIYLTDGKKQEKNQSPLWIAITEGKSLSNVEGYILHPDGEKIELLSNASPILGENGKVTGAILLVHDITRLKQAEEAMRKQVSQIEVQQRLMDHLENERAHIARDLHDGPLQEMIGLSFSFSRLQQQLEGERQEIVSQLDTLQAYLQEQIDDLRHFCTNLRPPILTHFGLESAIRSHAETFRKKYPDIHIHLFLTPDRLKLPDPIRVAIFRVYQELMNNSLRHANPSKIFVRFDYTKYSVLLEVEDNGCGFKVPDDWIELARNGHFGLVGIKERIQAIGGSILIESDIDNGTIVRIQVPYKI